jgi:hypothetical protein
LPTVVALMQTCTIASCVVAAVCWYVLQVDDLLSICILLWVVHAVSDADTVS